MYTVRSVSSNLDLAWSRVKMNAPAGSKVKLHTFFLSRTLYFISRDLLPTYPNSIYALTLSPSDSHQLTTSLYWCVCLLVKGRWGEWI